MSQGKFRILNHDNGATLDMRIVRPGTTGEPESLRSEFEILPGDAQLFGVHDDCVLIVAPRKRGRFSVNRS